MKPTRQISSDVVDPAVQFEFVLVVVELVFILIWAMGMPSLYAQHWSACSFINQHNFILLRTLMMMDGYPFICSSTLLQEEPITKPKLHSSGLKNGCNIMKISNQSGIFMNQYLILVFHKSSCIETINKCLWSKL